MWFIPLTQGKFATVDDEDYERVSQHKWSAKRDAGNWYATTNIPKIGGGHRTVRMHRFIMNAPENMVVDHRDHNGLNNCRNNLRLCTRAENQFNQIPSRGITSQFKGVCWRKDIGKWVAQLRHGGRHYHLGFFVEEREAGLTYDNKAQDLFGEFAFLNFPTAVKRDG